MLALFYGCGLRRSEAVALLLDDYDHGKVTVRSGKGRKERIVYCPVGGREAINAWIARRGLAPGALLNPVNKAGHIQHRPMTAQAVLLRLHFLADQAGVSRFSPHDLRRSFVGELLDAGADISSVQQLVGHANVATTQRYDRRPEEAKRRTAEMLHVPYVAPVLLVSAVPADPRATPPPDQGLISCSVHLSQSLLIRATRGSADRVLRQHYRAGRFGACYRRLSVEGVAAWRRSWPQAAATSWPFSLRTVTGTARRRSACTKACTRVAVGRRRSANSGTGL